METVEQIVARLVDESKKGNKVVRIESGTTASDVDILEWEKRNSLLLPPDYKYFLKKIGCCRLHGAEPTKSHSFSVKFLPLNEVVPFTLAAYGTEDESISKCWFAIGDSQDGNYIVMDLQSTDGDSVNIIDGFSEGVLNGVAIIAKSFTEFLKRSLADPDTSSGSGNTVRGTRYWSTLGGYYGEVGKV